MSTAALLTLLAALAQGGSGGRRTHTSAGAAVAAGPGPADCDTQIKLQISTAPGRMADPSCWRLGKIALGMSRFDVRQLLGAPDFDGDSPPDPINPDLRYGLAIYVFPRNLSTSLAVEPVSTARYRLLEVVYRDDAVVRVDSHPPQTVSRSACRGGPRRATSDLDVNSLVGGFSPFQSFASVHQGDAVASLRRRFGRAPEADPVRSRAGYAKTPISFEIDPKTSKILGFSLSSDPSASAESGVASVFLQRDPMTCQIRGYKILPRGPAA